MRRFAFATIACTSCATGYNAATSHRTLGNNAYLVTADGNGFTSRSTINEYMYRRASELCPGGFDVIDSDRSTDTRLATFDGGKTYNTIQRPSGSLAIACTEEPSYTARSVAPADVAGEPPEARQRKVVTGKRPIYCTTWKEDVDVGACFLIEQKCTAKYESMTADGNAYTPCAPAKGAACFNAVHIIGNDRVTICAPSITECESQLATLKLNPDFTVNAEACGVYRTVLP